MPTVHSGDRIRMNWKSHILVNSTASFHQMRRVSGSSDHTARSLFPLAGPPLRAVVVQLHRRHQLSLSFVSQFPAAHVMTARHDAWSNSFRDPRRHDVVADLGFHAYEIAGAYAELRLRASGESRADCVRDLVQPLGVGATRVNLDRQPERRDQDRLVFLKVVLWT